MRGIAADRLICSSVLAEPVENDGASAILATAFTTLTARKLYLA